LPGRGDGTFPPSFDIFAVVIEREPVPVTEIEVAVFAVERKIGAFPADCTILIEGVLLLFTKSGKE